MTKIAKRVMFQGTSSHVGKSILTTAFCRILAQDGYKTAPFKAQNMALNSYVTLSGGEIGRSTVAQAEAAGALPIVQMNPVLFKAYRKFLLPGHPSGNIGRELQRFGIPESLQPAGLGYGEEEP